SLEGLATIQRHFTAGEIGPVTVLLVADGPWDSPAGLLQIDHLSRGISRLDNVAEVRTLTQPLGMHLPILAVDPEGRGLINLVLRTLQPALTQFQDEMIVQGKPHYVAQFAAGSRDGGGAVTKYATRFDIVLNSDPFDPRSAQTLRILQTWLDDELVRGPILTGPIQVEYYGVTANAVDL